MWTCQTCGHRFALRNQTHSCGTHSVRQHLSHADPNVVQTYDALVEFLERLGDFTIHPVKTRIGFCNRMTFCAVWVRRRFLGGHLVLEAPPASDRFTPGELPIVHRFRLNGPDEIDTEFQMYLRRAWERGMTPPRS